MKTKSNVRDISKTEIDDFLQQQRVGVLSLTDGQSSYAVPLAYFYENDTIYLTIGRSGRKMDYIQTSKKVCFVVYWVPEGFGAPGTMHWTSVICDGILENITEPEEITRAVRAGEKHMGMPEGTWDRLLEMTLKKPEASNFWRIRVKQFGGRGVENFTEEFQE